MELIILGSGGCTSIPRPICQCKVCKEARKRGIPYYRTGSSIFLKQLNALFDTPEDIKEQLNRESTKTVDNIFYTHWHPDHTFGLRVVEQMNRDFLAEYIENKKPLKKVKILALSEVMNDLLSIKSRHGSFLSYYKNVGLLSFKKLKDSVSFKIKNHKITAIPVKTSITSTVFVIENKNKKNIYAPCNYKPFPLNNSKIKNANILIIGGIVPDGPLKDGYVIPEENRLREEAYFLSELK